MLSAFGKFLRHLRIERGELIKDMANKLGITVSYLSAVETGKRTIPSQWISKICSLYSLDHEQETELRNAADASTTALKLDLETASETRRRTAVLFAREFDSLDEEQLEVIRNILLKRRSEVDE